MNVYSSLSVLNYPKNKEKLINLDKFLNELTIKILNRNVNHPQEVNSFIQCSLKSLFEMVQKSSLKNKMHRRYNKNVNPKLQDIFVLSQKKFENILIEEFGNTANQSNPIMLKKISYLSNLFAHSVYEDIYHKFNHHNHQEHTSLHAALNRLLINYNNKNNCNCNFHSIYSYLNGNKNIDINEEIKKINNLIQKSHFPLETIDINLLKKGDISQKNIINLLNLSLQTAEISNLMFSIKANSTEAILALYATNKDKQNFDIDIKIAHDSFSTIKKEPACKVMMHTEGDLYPTIMHITKNSLIDIERLTNYKFETISNPIDISESKKHTLFNFNLSQSSHNFIDNLKNCVETSPNKDKVDAAKDQLRRSFKKKGEYYK